jgi:hypothetical protein
MYRAAYWTKRQAVMLSGDLLPWSTPNRSLAIHIVTIIYALHPSKAMFRSTTNPGLYQLIECGLGTTDIYGRRRANWPPSIDVSASETSGRSRAIILIMPRLSF